MRRVAIHQIDHAGWHASVDEHSNQGSGRGRCFLGGLHHHRATGRQGRGELAYDLVNREIPGCKRSDWAHRFFDDQLVNIVLAGGDDAAIGASPFFRKPVDGVGTGHHFQARLGQGLALLHGHQAGHLVSTLAQQLRRFAHGLVALKGADAAPYFKPALGRISGLGDVFQVRTGQLAHDSAGSRVTHWQAARAGTWAPLAVDMELDVGVVSHGFLFG